MKAILSTITLALALFDFVAAQSTTVSGQDLCRCYSEFASCKYGLNANHAGCSAAYEKCVGHTPSGSIVTPTSCTIKATEAQYTITSHSIPTSSTSIGNECECYSEFQQCSNHAGCVSKYAQCLGISTFGPIPVPTTCSTSTLGTTTTGLSNHRQSSGVSTTSTSVSSPTSTPTGAAEKVVIGGSGLFAAVVAVLGL